MFRTFLSVLQPYVDADVIEFFWKELAICYSEPHRHYHTLQHVEDLHAELEHVEAQFLDHESLMLAVVYHDAVYDVRRKDNEEASARLAADHLRRTTYPATRVSRVQQLILATCDHQATGDGDIDLLTDADLAILGSTADRYLQYTRQVRQEYSIFTDEEFRAGRMRFLQHQLALTQIFKTRQFGDRYEERARQNLARELQQLESCAGA